MLQDYLVCGGNSSQTIDFFSLNAYEWCGASSYQVSGYSTLQAEAKSYPIPIFFSETGCNTAPPRTFSDQAAILGSDMVDTWSGAIIYEWIEETNNYGLISYAGTNTASGGSIVRSGKPMPVTPDFSNLQSQWATLSPSGVALSAYSASTSALSTPACPSSTPSGWVINGNPPIPTIGQSATFDPVGSQVPSVAATATATAATGSGSGGSPSGSASASATKGSANGGKEVAGMTVGLGMVLLGFVVWL